MTSPASKSNPNSADKPDLTVDEQLLAEYDGVVPGHVAVIMDGNGRWATSQGKPRLAGHREGANAVRRTVESCRYLGVETLTLYAFSSQNWQRPDNEVSGLMQLFQIYIRKERQRLIDNDIELQVIGERDQLGDDLQRAIADLEEVTSSNDEMTLQVAVSYGGREEILRAVHLIAEEVEAGELSAHDIDQSVFESHLYTTDTSDPDLLVRTSGEMRLSNFLLWQVAYSEIYVTDVLWPDFGEADLIGAFTEFGDRERRFGKTGQQLDNSDS